MQSITDIRSEFIHQMESYPPLQAVGFYHAYPVSGQALPIKGTKVAVELAEIGASKLGMNGYIGLGESGAVFGAKLRVVLCLSIMCDARKGAEGCWEALGHICDRLFVGESSLSPTELSAQSIQYDNRLSGMVLKAAVTLCPMRIGDSTGFAGGFEKVEISIKEE